jgi:hypothetical protein
MKWEVKAKKKSKSIRVLLGKAELQVNCSKYHKSNHTSDFNLTVTCRVKIYATKLKNAIAICSK